MEKGSKLMIWSLVIAATGCALLLFSILTPWWTASNTITDKDAEGKPDGYDNERDLVYLGGGIHGGDSAYSQEVGTAIVTGVTTYGVVTALLFALIALSLMVLAASGRKVHIIVFTIFGVLVMFFCIATPIVFAISLPYAIENDDRKMVEEEGGTYEDKENTPKNSLYGSHEETTALSDGTRTTEQIWGPDIGFFLDILSILVLVTSYVMFFIGRGQGNGS